MGLECLAHRSFFSSNAVQLEGHFALRIVTDPLLSPARFTTWTMSLQTYEEQLADLWLILILKLHSIVLNGMQALTHMALWNVVLIKAMSDVVRGRGTV